MLGGLVCQDVVQPGGDALEVLVAFGQDARVHEGLADVVQVAAGRQFVEQVVAEGPAGGGEVGQQPGVRAAFEPAQHPAGVLGAGQGLQQGPELGGDVAVRAGQVLFEPNAQHTAGTTSVRVEASAGPTAGAGVDTGQTGARTTDRLAVLAAGDQRLPGATAAASPRMVEDPDIARPADRTEGPAGLDPPGASATGARALLAGTAGPAGASRPSPGRSCGPGSASPWNCWPGSTNTTSHSRPSLNPSSSSGSPPGTPALTPSATSWAGPTDAASPSSSPSLPCPDRTPPGS